MLEGLLDATRNASMDELPSLVSQCAGRAGLDEAVIYLADLQQDVLRRLTGHGLNAGSGFLAEELSIGGTAAGAAFQELGIVPDGQSDREDCLVRWVPLLDGTERLGVMRIRTSRIDEQVEADVRHLADVVALLVVSRRTQSDSHARLVRTRPMNVSAEMQWNLMPPLTFANSGVTITAAFEPAYEIAGDAFDYALADQTMHLAVFDAMGHDVTAGLTANLAVSACRNQRRQGTALGDLGPAIEKVIREQFEHVRYLTGVLGELDMRTGLLTWTNHGHQPPLIIRNNQWLASLHCPPSHPLGMDVGTPVTVSQHQLEPGDRVLLYTDGIVEARHPSDGSEFGVDRLVELLTRNNSSDSLPVPEVLRRLIHSVMDYQEGCLGDDATILLMEWLGARKDDGVTLSASTTPN